jgi:hypothetical protein
VDCTRRTDGESGGKRLRGDTLCDRLAIELLSARRWPGGNHGGGYMQRKLHGSRPWYAGHFPNRRRPSRVSCHRLVRRWCPRVCGRHHSVQDPAWRRAGRWSHHLLPTQFAGPLVAWRPRSRVSSFEFGCVCHALSWPCCHWDKKKAFDPTRSIGPRGRLGTNKTPSRQRTKNDS